jgi:hypothetical protein
MLRTGGVCEEHHETINAHTPAARWWKAVFETGMGIRPEHSRNKETNTYASTKVSSIPCASSSPWSFCLAYIEAVPSTPNSFTYV